MRMTRRSIGWSEHVQIHRRTAQGKAIAVFRIPATVRLVRRGVDEDHMLWPGDHIVYDVSIQGAKEGGSDPPKPRIACSGLLRPVDVIDCRHAAVHKRPSLRRVQIEHVIAFGAQPAVVIGIRHHADQPQGDDGSTPHRGFGAAEEQRYEVERAITDDPARWPAKWLGLMRSDTEQGELEVLFRGSAKNLPDDADAASAGKTLKVGGVKHGHLQCLGCRSHEWSGRFSRRERIHARAENPHNSRTRNSKAVAPRRVPTRGKSNGFEQRGTGRGRPPTAASYPAWANSGSTAGW